MTSKGQPSTFQSTTTHRRRVADYFGLERNVVVSAVVFLLGFDEELWKRYLPKYLEALGAGAGLIGIIGTIVFAATVEER